MGRTQRVRQHRKANLIKTQMQTALSTPTNYLPSLYKYLSSCGWSNETQLKVRNFRETGRGLCSKRSVIAHDVLIKIPIKALINIDTLEEDSNFKNIFDSSKFSKDLRIPFQSLLALYVLYQKHLKSDSIIESYLKSIPLSFTMPYFCAKSELYSLPEAILEKTVEQNFIIRTSFNKLQTVVTDNTCQCCGREFFPDIFDMAAFKWAYFAINSRCVYINSEQLNNEHGTFFKSLLNDGTNMALAPFLDLFNHSDCVSTKAVLKASEKNKKLDFVLTLENVASRILPYEQIFISYGALTNFKLLTDYGFFLPGNKNDLFEISLQDIENFIKNEKAFDSLLFHRNKFKFIRDHNLNDQMFVHWNDGISHNLHVVLHILFKESTHYPNVLNQIAFGAVENLNDVSIQVKMLVMFKIKEYMMFISGLKIIETLSDSGNISLKYMEECIRYLEKFLNSYKDVYSN